MSDPSSATGTVNLHRILAAPPARVYRAFIDPDALVRWLPPYGFTARMHEYTPGVGGGYRMSFTNFGTGASESFTVRFEELVENELIRHTDRFDNPGLPGVMQVTVTLRPSVAGTELQIVQEGIPAAIPVDMCYLGWRDSLDMLTRLVEPEIPDGA
jgi:uncharacterized protein YndB with AHSA1/START domain